MFTEISEVKNWKELQDRVQELLSELGYSAHTAHEVELANGGKAEVDVYAEKGNSALPQRILVECKYWDQDVPRAIVQSFKMDVQEAGANYGIVIAKRGFQSGAYEGITLTTVKLFTFEELQIAFANEWFAQNIRPLDLLYGQLVDEARAFEFGTFEREYFEKSQFDEELKQLAANLQHLTGFALALYKDYRPDNALWRDDPIEWPFDNKTVPGRVIRFHDARSFANAMKGLLEECVQLWAQYRGKWEKLFLNLPPEQQKAVLLGK